MLLRLRVTFRKELRQFLQSKLLIALVIWLFVDVANDGYSMSLDARNVSLLVIDHDQTSASRTLGERFRIAPYFTYQQADGRLDPDEAIEGGAGLVLVIPAGFGRALDRGESAPVQLVADGTFSNISVLTLGYAYEIIDGYSTDLTDARVARTGTPYSAPRIVHDVRIWYLPGLDAGQATVMTMAGIVALVVGVLLPAAAIVREKEAGTLEQLLVTPLRPWELMAAKLAPMGVLMVLGVGIGLAEACWLFGAPMRGSLPLFFGLSSLLLFASMGLGACIGALTHNLQQALLVIFALLFPMSLLSGTFVPIEEMPLPLQWLTFLSPLRYYLPIAEGIVFKGVGLEVLAADAAALGAYGLVTLAIGARLLRRNLAA